MIRTRKQNSTGRPITFLLVSSTDHVTPQTGKSPTVTLSKDGGAFGAASGAVSEIASGLYALAGNATDRDTLGELVIRATATGCDDVMIACVIVATDPFDGNLGLSNLDAAVSSRSTYVGSDTSGTTTLLSRLTSGRATGLDHLDADVSSRATPANLSALATESNATANKAAVLAAVAQCLQASGYTAPPDSGTIAAAVLTKRVEDVIAGLGSSDDHTLAFVIELFTEAARIAGAIRVRKPDGTTWKDKTITENATQNPVESIT